MSKRAVAAALLCLAGWPGPSPADDPRPALVVRSVRPDEQLGRLIALFEGGPAAHPAEALSSWRRSTGRHEVLSKATQAAITLLNPQMIPELRALDGAEIHIWFDGDRTRWFALVPHDDGTFAALTTALALTDGAVDEPLSEIAVDRAGRPGSALLGRSPDGAVLLADDREDLAAARQRLRSGPHHHGAGPSGWRVLLDPQALNASPAMLARRMSEGFRVLGLGPVEAMVGLEGESLTVDIRGNLDAKVASRPIDPTWLDGIPAGRAAAAVSLSLGPSGWDAVFALADQIEKSDPSRAGTAPLRARLGLAALAAGVQLEIDLWPLVEGVTAWIELDEAGRVVTAALELHTADAATAQRLERRAIRPLLTGRLAKLLGGPLEATVLGGTVVLGWGPAALASASAARNDPRQSAASRIRVGWTSTAPSRAGAFWPGALVRVSGSEYSSALADTPPLVWLGHTEAGATRDTVRWDGLKAPLRRYLERLPRDRADFDPRQPR